jgi:hypothetical protein
MSIFPDDTWTIGTADQDGQPIIVRVRAALPDLAQRKALGQLIVIGWPYDGNAAGLPDAGDSAAMQAFEDAIEAGVERKGAGVQAASLTGAGHKEWRYYAADADAFVAALNDSLDGHPTYPLEIEMFDDAEWHGQQQLLDGLEDDDGEDEDGDDPDADGGTGDQGDER